MVIFIIVCILGALAIAAKYFYLLYNINKKKRNQRIITPGEIIQMRNWTIIFVATTVAVLIGLGSVLISYF